MQNSLLIFILIDAALLIALIVFKTILLYKASHRRKIGKWFFFSKYDIINSSTDYSRQLKKRQNLLSVLLVVYFVLSAVAGFYIKMATA
ncbi:MAG TPA: hypothetical protein VG738_04790 [Chitinophagaceae bacterium]|nr:hypothetical protein [Chitinophagaceae bacterium]